MEILQRTFSKCGLMILGGRELGVGVSVEVVSNFGFGGKSVFGITKPLIFCYDRKL